MKPQAFLNCEKDVKIVGVIPCRLESSRLPNKPLAEICGIPMIIHVWERCLQSELLDEVIVATDSDEIRGLIEKFGGRVKMTSRDHQTGTDRIAEAISDVECDVVVNIQGDEALLDPDHIDLICDFFKKNLEYNVGLLVTNFNKKSSASDIKVVLNKMDEIMYLSRSDIPSDSRSEVASMLKAYHIVPFRKEFLLRYAEMEKSPLEIIESNEYLRILENGFKIKALRVDQAFISVDTPEDLEFIRKEMVNDSLYKKYSQKYLTF